MKNKMIDHLLNSIYLANGLYNVRDILLKK